MLYLLERKHASTKKIFINTAPEQAKTHFLISKPILSQYVFLIQHYPSYY